MADPYLRFGQGDEAWCAPDITNPRFAEGMHRARYPRPDQEPNFAVAEVAETFAHLVLGCTTTKLACEKLAKIRAAVRARKETRHG